MNFFEKRSLALALTLICLAGLNLSCGSSDLPEETLAQEEKFLARKSVEVVRPVESGGSHTQQCPCPTGICASGC